MRTEMSQVKKETNAYLTSVEKSKQIAAITQRKVSQGVAVSISLSCDIHMTPIYRLQVALSDAISKEVSVKEKLHINLVLQTLYLPKCFHNWLLFCCFL